MEKDLGAMLFHLRFRMGNSLPLGIIDKLKSSLDHQNYLQQ